MKNFAEITGGFQINREVISKLQDKQMLDIIGGKGTVGFGCSNGAQCTCTKQSCVTAKS